MNILLVLPCLLVLAYANPITNNDLNLSQDILHKDLNREKRHFGHSQVAVAPVAHHVQPIHHVQPSAYHQQPILLKKPFFRETAEEIIHENVQPEKEILETGAKNSEQPDFKENLKKTIEAVDSMKRELVDIEQNRAALMKEFDTNSELHDSLQKARETLEQVGKNFDIEKDSPKQPSHKVLSHLEPTTQLKMTSEQRSSQWKKPVQLQLKEAKQAKKDEQTKKTEEQKMRAAETTDSRHESKPQVELDMTKTEMENAASSPKEAVVSSHPDLIHEHARNEDIMWHNNHNADMKSVSMSQLNNRPLSETNKKQPHHDRRENIENMRFSADLSSSGSHLSSSKSAFTNEMEKLPKSAVIENEFTLRSNSQKPSMAEPSTQNLAANSDVQKNNHLQVPAHNQFPEPRPIIPMQNASPMPQQPKSAHQLESSIQHVQPAINHHHSHVHTSHGKSAEIESMLPVVPMNKGIGKERFANEMKQWKKFQHQTEARSSYGAESSYGLIAGSNGGDSHSGGAIGYFPNANIHGCSLPLLISCSPSVISGHLSRPVQAQGYVSQGYSSPAYRSEDNMREMKPMELSGVQASKIKRTPSQDKKNKKH